MKRPSLLTSFSVVVVVTLLALSLGCARKPDDAKISSEVQSKFGQDSGLSSKQLTVQAADGVVTLGGYVDNAAQRDAASRQAASVAGVKQVLNNLQIGNPPAVAANVSPQPQPVAIAPSNSAKPGAGKKPNKAARKDSRGAEGATGGSNSDSMNSNPQQLESDPGATPLPAENTPAQAPPPPAPKKLIIDQGTQISVRLIDPIDSEKNVTGDTFHATLNAPLTSDGEEAVPAGVELTGHLVEVKSAGKFAGQSTVALQLDSLSAGGRTYSLQTDQYRKTGSSRGKNTAEKVGGGAIVGGIIGAIAGGGKGAAIGSAAGAGVGGGVQAATKGQQIKLPSETVLNFILQEPITVVQAASPDADRPKLPDSH